ncbi:MAG TPA: aspartyl/asparaginyl beta-hydroxylase domain-containing protein [Xanthomonadaceae bacterium]|nr:aspartyl/asparaginyl beta-hydroxylase domain-containing protein [Xanthomonadaceae bacterium]
MAAAEEGLGRVLEIRPDHADALRLLARIKNARGDRDEAVILFSRAARAAPQNVGVLAELGVTYQAAERFDAARYTLERAAGMSAGRNPSIRLLLAHALELDARPELALLHYFRAMLEARQARRWTDPGDAAPDADRLIPHARHFMAEQRRAWFERALDPLRRLTPTANLDRIDAALAMHLGERDLVPGDPRQQAGIFHVPGILAACFPDVRFDWLAQATASLTGLGDEIEACLAAAPPGADAGVVRRAVHRRGNVQYEARRHAPRLLSLLDDLPLARIPNNAPDVDIVALPAGTRMAGDRGRMNSRCLAIIHLDGGEIEMIVGGESRMLAARAHLVLDPSFGVEYRNASATRARLLVLDVWHPDLSDVEQQALSALIVAALDFDTRMQELA